MEPSIEYITTARIKVSTEELDKYIESIEKHKAIYDQYSLDEHKRLVEVNFKLYSKQIYYALSESSIKINLHELYDQKIEISTVDLIEQ